MKKITIIAHFSDVGEGDSNGRFSYIANNLSSLYDVTLITSDFSHYKKKKKQLMEEVFPYKTIYAHESPYKKNISIKRLFSHKGFAKNVYKILNDQSKPDLVYCAIPSLDVGKVAADYCKENDIPFIIDVQDIWPEAFHLVFHISVISNIIFAPMYRTAKYIYNSADQIIAVSQTYVDIALKSNRNLSHGHSVYLGTSLSKFDDIVRNAKVQKPGKEIWITYIGTLGHSYNIKCIIDALAKYPGYENTEIKLIVMGNGPLQKEFEEYAKSKEIDARFMGRLPYDEMVGYLVASDITVNPISKGAAQSIINKVGDYAAAGLPVINTQENREYRDAVEKYGFGINSENEDIEGIESAIEKLIRDPSLRKEMGKNNRKYAEMKFDRDKAYEEIYETIDYLME